MRLERDSDPRLAPPCSRCSAPELPSQLYPPGEIRIRRVKLSDNHHYIHFSPTWTSRPMIWRDGRESNPLTSHSLHAWILRLGKGIPVLKPAAFRLAAYPSQVPPVACPEAVICTKTKIEPRTSRRFRGDLRRSRTAISRAQNTKSGMSLPIQTSRSALLGGWNEKQLIQGSHLTAPCHRLLCSVLSSSNVSLHEAAAHSPKPQAKGRISSHALLRRIMWTTAMAENARARMDASTASPAVPKVSLFFMASVFIIRRT